MAQENNIEYSNAHGKFTAAEIRAKIAESKKFWASPEGIAEKRKQDIAARNRKPIPARFPELNGTKPSVAQWSEKINRLSKKKI